MLSIEDRGLGENNAYPNGAQRAQQLGVLPPQRSFGERAFTANANAKTGLARRTAVCVGAHSWAQPPSRSKLETFSVASGSGLPLP